MSMMYPIQVNTFYQAVEQLCGLAGLKNTNTHFSKKMYGNIRLAFLACYREKLNVSYIRLVEMAEEQNLQRMLCIKRIPHYTTIQKFVQRTPKKLFEKLVRACHKLLNFTDIAASIDGTGFSNTNPSHYYLNRIDTPKAGNYTKTVLLSDNKSKLVLNIRTHSDHSSECRDFIPMVQELRNALITILADKGYDSMQNRRYCWDNGIEVHIPFREWKQTRKGYGHVPRLSKHRRKACELFEPDKYRYRNTVESVNSAIKRTLGGYVRARKAGNQQKQVTLKALAYNLEVVKRRIVLWLFIF